MRLPASDGLTPFARRVLALLKKHNDGVTTKQLSELSGIRARTLQFSLRRLLELAKIKRTVNLMDARQHLYYPINIQRDS